MQTTTRPRDPEGIHNFRELGTYRLAGGGHLRPGMVYRSGALEQMTAADTAYLGQGLGIRTIIDLRHPDEMDGLPAAHALSTRVVPISIFSEERAQVEVTAELNGLYGPAISSERYLHYLELGGHRFARALTLFGEPERYPILVHCTAGKDRTGVLVGILMDLLGCSLEDIAREYELSEAATDRLIAFLRATGRQIEGTDDEIRERLATPGHRMSGFVELLRGRFGGGEGFLRAQGVPQAVIDSARGLLTA